MNPLLTLLGSHRTIRRFRPTPLEDPLVERAVRAAQHAATSSNVQAYALLRLRDPATRASLVELTGGQPQVAEAGAFFVLCADQRRHRLLADRCGVPYEANFETFLVSVVDASLFAQNLVIAFESEGLGTCYIGGLRNDLPAVDRLLGLPPDVFPLYGLCVGEPDETPSLRPRLPLQAILLEERYPSDEETLAQVARYDARMEAYYRERGRPGHDWSAGVARKFARPLREALFGYYSAKGARLR